jgi:hypothetical protein
MFENLPCASVLRLGFSAQTHVAHYNFQTGSWKIIPETSARVVDVDQFSATAEVPADFS